MKKIVAKFEIPYYQYIDEHGNASEALPESVQNKNELIKLYRYLTLLRIFDNKAINLQRTGKIGTYASILGQEAISVAIGACMHQDDVFFPAYREFGTYIQRNITLTDILCYWGGDERGNHFANPNDFPMSVPIASQCLHAAGAATAFKIRNEKRVAVTVCGDGATSKGDFYEALNVAGCWKLPIVFVVNNNQWAISVPRHAQTGAETLAQKALAAGFSGIQVDGNDVVGLRIVIQEAINQAREHHQPTLIEAITYRLCDHTTADDAKRYRPEEELQQAWHKEPLIRIRKFLQTQYEWSDHDEKELLSSCAEEVDQAIKNYLEKAAPQAEDIFNYIYAKWPESLAEQLQNLQDYKHD